MQETKKEPGYTLRLVEPEAVHPQLGTIVHGITGLSLKALSIKDHVFISVLGSASQFQTEEGTAIGLFMAGTRSISIAGYFDENCDLTEEEWLQQVAITVAHELYHYHQYVNDQEICEERAEMFGKDVMQEYFYRP